MMQQNTTVPESVYSEKILPQHKVVIDDLINIGVTNRRKGSMTSFFMSLTGCEDAIAKLVAKEINFDLRGIEFEVRRRNNRTDSIGDKIDLSSSDKVQVNAKVDTTESEDRIQELQHIVGIYCPIYKTADVEMASKWTKA